MCIETMIKVINCAINVTKEILLQSCNKNVFIFAVDTAALQLSSMVTQFAGM